MRLVNIVLVGAAIVMPRIAWGQAAPAPPVAADETSDAKAWIGGQLDLMPSGTLHESVLGMSASADMASAIAFGGVLDYRVSPLVTLGFAPRVVLNVKLPTNTNSAKQFDLRARVTVGKDVAPKFRLYGIGTLGYSIMLLPTDPMGNTYHPHGLILGFGGGISYAINPRLLFIGELSYQLGYQGTTAQGVSVSFGDDYLTLGGGLLAALD